MYFDMQRVLLQDELAEQFGAVHEYHNLRTPVDAIRLLCINYPDFAKHLIESGENGIGYKVVQSETDLSLEEMTLPFGSNDLIITPVITGSGKGAGMILMGAALIGLAVVTGGVGFGVGGASGFGAWAGTGAISSAIAIGGNIGIALTLGGISQMLSPQPDFAPRFTPGSMARASGPGSVNRGSDGQQSYAMTGAVNSVGAGATIPVAYGKTLIGSHLISANIEVTDESDPLNTWIKTPSPDTLMVNGEVLSFTFQDAGGIKAKKVADDGIKGGYQVLSPQNIPLDSNAHVNLATIIGESDDNYPTHKCQLGIELPTGIYSYVAGEDSTKVDGFITLEVKSYNTDDNRWVGNMQFTVQGLMSATQSQKFVIQFAYGKIAHKDNYRQSIAVIDTNVDLNVNTLKVVQLGYKFVPYD